MSRVLPILFNTDMVRAILDGRKTVTRRICKDANEYTVPDMSFCDADKRTYAVHNYADKDHTDKLSIAERTCPICPGDILYVRETWHKYKKRVGKGEGCHIAEFYGYKANIANSEDANEPWKPSIHMPKEAARIWLKVKDVRVERLQDITEEQAKAEGIREYSKDGKLWKYAVTDDWWISYHHKYRKFFVGSWWQDMPRTAKEAFHHLWNSTLGRRDTPEWYANNWSGNPWVWVIEFERCEKPEGWCV